MFGELQPPRNRCQAPTAFAPFCLHTEMRLPQKNKMTTDELRIAELKKQRQEEAMKRRTQLRRLQHERARTESPDVLSPRATKAKPFQLASVARHEREMQARKAMLMVSSAPASAPPCSCGACSLIRGGRCCIQRTRLWRG